MNVFDWIHQFGLQCQQASGLEWVAVIFGVLQVVLAWRNFSLNFLAGIISTSCSVFLLFQVKLYAEAALNMYYFIMSLYGWWFWISKKSNPVEISKTDSREWKIALGVIGLGTVAFYILLSKITKSDVPFWDAWVSATAWAGMYLLAKRKIENWLVLNVSNLFAIPLQLYKGIYLYALLTFILFVLAFFGYFSWRKKWKAIEKSQSTRNNWI